jgi:hypothetical protein
MDWMLLVVNRVGEPPAEAVGMAEMGQFAGELTRQGKLRGGAPLHAAAAGARVSVRGGRATVTDGPFAEAREIVGGFFVIDAATRDEAIEIAKRCPHARAGVMELRPLPDRDVGASAKDTSFMLLLQEGLGLTDPDGAKYREMVAFDGVLRREGSYVECAQLPHDPPGAKIETRGGKTIVTDGPFSETKEIAGGYYIVAAPDRAAAIEIAKRCPHARWGAIDVREIMKVGGM